MIRLTIIDADVEREWVADEFGVFTFTRWCEANELPVVALVSGSIEVLERDRTAVVRFGAYQPDPAGGWRSDGAGRPLIIRAEQPLALRLPRHVRGRVLTEQDAADPAPPAAAEVPDEQQLTL